MQSYWDFTEEERSKLTREQVEGLLKYELMEQGVLQPTPPKLEPEEPPALERHSYYRVTLHFESWSHDTIPVLFRNPVDARTFLEMEWLFEDYEHGEHCARVRTEQQITSVELPSYEQVGEQQDRISRARLAKERNTKKNREYEEQLRKVAETTKRVWDDWEDRREYASHLETIREKYQEYFEMAGDSQIALKFLLKVPQFECNDIVKALPEYAENVYDLSGTGPEENIPAEVKDDPDMSTNDISF